LHGDIHQPEFSRRLAERGWVGMSIPAEYGGHDRGALERFVILEELLAVGAPIGAHGVADRQSAPMLLAHGSEAQRRQFLPGIAAGEVYFSVGMSEPGAGSDLAGIRTRATKVDGGWLLNGTKIWTSGAHERPFCIVLCRTEPMDPNDRHKGMSQMVVDLRGPGITLRPIPFMDGTHQFNEVHYADAFVADESVLGTVGDGWNQVMEDLSFERAGPERLMSTWPTLIEWLGSMDLGDVEDDVAETLGRLVARFWIIRQMCLSQMNSMGSGDSRAEGAVVKDLATTFEQEVVAGIQHLVDRVPELGSEHQWESVLAEAILMTPSTTIRGGTVEMLRSIVSRAVRPGH
jgi:hypothetical protein